METSAETERRIDFECRSQDPCSAGLPGACGLLFKVLDPRSIILRTKLSHGMIFRAEAVSDTKKEGNI
jgi:hypothetical protein